MAKYTVPLAAPPTCFHDGCKAPVMHVYINEEYLNTKTGVIEPRMCFSCDKLLHRAEVAEFFGFSKTVTEVSATEVVASVV